MPKARKSFDKGTKTKVSGLFVYQYPVRSRNGLFVWYLTFRESWGETTSKRYHTLTRTTMSISRIVQP